MSIGYLPGAHAPSCPVYRKVLELQPMWAQKDGRRVRAGN
jgi:DNA-3-methyladenine glycosylase I